MFRPFRGPKWTVTFQGRNNVTRKVTVYAPDSGAAIRKAAEALTGTPWTPILAASA